MLAAWYEKYARDLPWRRTNDPYAVLVSEFICQQTTVAAAVPLFERWMTRFPTVSALAAASEDDVLAVWQGLGYYSRGRNLLKAARAVVADWDGEIPASLADLERLPGVGRYTACAVAAFAFDQPAPVVDANVARVLARLHDFRDSIDSATGKTFLESAAASLQPARGGRLHNSAMMELGALVCRPRTPLCLACPVRDECRAVEPETLPVKRPRAVTEHVTERRAFVFDGHSVFLQSASGSRWRGMWLLPEVSEGNPIHVETYPITRFRVRMEVVLQRPGVTENLRAFPVTEIAEVAIPAPHRRVILRMLGKSVSEEPNRDENRKSQGRGYADLRNVIGQSGDRRW